MTWCVRYMTAMPVSRPPTELRQHFVAAASGRSSATAMQHITPATETNKSSINFSVMCALKKYNASKAPSGSAKPATVGTIVACQRDLVASYVAMAKVKPSGMLCKATAMQIVRPNQRPESVETATAKPSGMLCAVSDTKSRMANRLLRASERCPSSSTNSASHVAFLPRLSPWACCCMCTRSPSLQSVRQASALAANKNKDHQEPAKRCGDNMSAETEIMTPAARLMAKAMADAGGPPGGRNGSARAPREVAPPAKSANKRPGVASPQVVGPGSRTRVMDTASNSSGASRSFGTSRANKAWGTFGPPSCTCTASICSVRQARIKRIEANASGTPPMAFRGEIIVRWSEGLPDGGAAPTGRSSRPGGRPMGRKAA
mmetsp:Transcript_66748/g.169192  ORF Transcript_66748/g.169192 Transcript_66748/m.169192 type:complete len:375 (-) Transcript_66748:2-1126(-)